MNDFIYTLNNNGQWNKKRIFYRLFKYVLPLGDPDIKGGVVEPY